MNILALEAATKFSWTESFEANLLPPMLMLEGRGFQRRLTSVLLRHLIAYDDLLSLLFSVVEDMVGGECRRVLPSTMGGFWCVYHCSNLKSAAMFQPLC